jgi:hypothetical protein
MKPTARLSLLTLLITTGLYLPVAQAQESTPAVLSPSESKKDLLKLEGKMDMGDVVELFREQQEELAAQRKLLEKQSAQITTLTQELESLRTAPAPEAQVAAQKELEAQRQQLESQSQQIETLTNELDALQALRPTESQLAITTTGQGAPAAAPSTKVADKPVGPALTEKQEQSIETGKEVAQAQVDDPTRALLDEFRGAWRLPGTDAALRFGGFVKTAIVYNNDPLQIKDRFIVGSIPVGVDETTGDEAQSSVTADQSRFNFDLRQPSEYGIFRAFVEGDFAGDSESFRLRHAFGQWRQVITGKTWTTFMDPDASPEEIDFEGLNGRINKRQAQVRVMPTFGKEYELQIALEDPDPKIENGSGISRTPDIVLAGRFYSYKRLHTKLALIARELRAQSDNGDVEKDFAWGASLSGSFATPQLDERDKLLFQLNYGDGIGSYVNDLSSIGNFDGVFEPGSDNLELFDVTAGYLSWQHWWGVKDLRSNFTLGAVEVDNPDFIGDDAYKHTLRFSTNLIWSPMSRIDLGGEYLWGERQNEDGSEGTATQVQVMAKYRF